RAVAAGAPATSAVVVVANGCGVVVEAEGRRLPAEGLGALPDRAIRSPLHLGDAERLVDLLAPWNARKPGIALVPTRGHGRRVPEKTLAPVRLDDELRPDQVGRDTPL